MAQLIQDDDSGKVKKDALIYQQRNDTDSKEEYKKLDRKGKIQFFKDYYLQTVFIVLVIVAICGYYIYETTTKPQTALYVAVADDKLDDQQVEKLEKAVEKYLNLNTKREVVVINTGYSSSNAESSRQLQTYFFAGSCDVVIASKEGFQGWAQGGYFLEPGTSKLVSFYEDFDEDKRIYTNVLDGEDIRGEKVPDKTEYNFGISLRDSEKYRGLDGLAKDAYIGISNSSNHQEEAVAFVKFMLDNDIKEGSVNPDFQPQK